MAKMITTKLSWLMVKQRHLELKLGENLTERNLVVTFPCPLLILVNWWQEFDHITFPCPLLFLMNWWPEFDRITDFWKKYFAVDNMEPVPLMEGEGRSFRVLGFNQSQRAVFVQILMRLDLTFFLISDPMILNFCAHTCICIHVSTYFPLENMTFLIEIWRFYGHYILCYCIYFAYFCSSSYFIMYLQVWGWGLWLEGVCIPLETEDIWRNKRVLNMTFLLIWLNMC